MNEQLQRAYDALQQAHEAGQAEHAQQIADYIRELEAQAMVQEEKKEKPATNNMLENPVTYGLSGAAAGRLLGPAVGAGIDTAARSMMNRKPPAPGAAPGASPAAAPKMEPSMAPPQPARLSEPPSLLDEPAIKSISHNTQQVIGHPAAMSLARKPEPGFEVRPGRLIATPEGADLSVEAPPQMQEPMTRSAAQLSAPPAATPPAAPPKPSMLSRMSRNLAEPKKTPLYLGGAMAAGQGRDAYEQAREGNIGQAAMSGAGAVGGLGMLSRIKPIRAAGTLMGLGVPLARMYKSLTEDEEKEKVERRAAGGLAGYAKGGKTAAWQRAEGKNPEGGLNAKGRASYKAETGGTLKRPQPEGGARRDSFCARMTGMKKKLTSAETANDPDSRINKSLRAWNCAEGGLIGLAGGGKTTPLRYAASWLLKERAPADTGSVYLRNPLHLADEARLSGFTSPEQNVFFGRTKTGQEFTIPREYVDPETILRSRDKNKTAEFFKDMFKEYKKPE